MFLLADPLAPLLGVAIPFLLTIIELSSLLGLSDWCLVESIFFELISGPSSSLCLWPDLGGIFGIKVLFPEGSLFSPKAELFKFVLEFEWLSFKLVIGWVLDNLSCGEIRLSMLLSDFRSWSSLTEFYSLSMNSSCTGSSANLLMLLRLD